MYLQTANDRVAPLVLLEALSSVRGCLLFGVQNSACLACVFFVPPVIDFSKLLIDSRARLRQAVPSLGDNSITFREPADPTGS